LDKDKKPIIFLADVIHPDGIKMLQKKFTLIHAEGKTNLQLLKIINAHSKSVGGNSALVIRSTRTIDKSFVRGLTGSSVIQLICTVSSGFNNIDIRECRNNGINVMNAAGGNSISAAEFTMALILAAYKSVIPANEAMKKGRFDFRVYDNSELSGKTIGIIGVGRVGSKVASMARAFDMNILGNDIDLKVKKKYRYIKFVSLKELLRSSDIVTIHTPLDESTGNLINSEGLKLMRKRSLLVNCARGGIVNEKALKIRLRKNSLFYSAIDVFESEPLFDREFTSFKNVILTPHLAGKTSESRKRMSVLAAENIQKYFSKNRSSLIFVN
jgi:D-3-phosphoglycerate dehydrogenase / 2-oxoglutarate reductase